MNTPTPRTDAAWSASFDGAQMSAGQTARALRECSQQLERELTALTTERDQLCAENATLRAAQKACEACDEPTAFEVRQLRARAEHAEAIVGKLQELHGCSQEMVVHWCEHAANRSLGLDQARSELATEREKSERYRLATLKLDAKLAAERARLDAGQILIKMPSERVWVCGVDLRAAIDAAMKEDAK
tara:strand:+ start:449 stop:1012 length:564 start_codon:yes stop_codon:yes gene_type:complete